MSARDALGLALSGADATSAALYAHGVAELQRFAGDPAAKAEAAIAHAPGFTMAHVLKGWLYGLSTERDALTIARGAFEAAAKLPQTAREKGHVAALGALTQGRWHEAGRMLQKLTKEEPRDALALQAGHQIDFFTGNAPSLRDRIAAALPAWGEGMPGYHAVLGMQAFGLEENGDYSAAERLGRKAVALEPRDGWAQHAVAHVMEMQSRQADGIAWMRENEANWTGDSFLQVHNWWHLALFHYDLGEHDAVLALFDRPIYGKSSSFVLNMVDASAILWRLHLGGVDVGDRWHRLAANWAVKAAAGNYAFNDAHAMMAFVGAGLRDAADDLLAAQREAMAGEGDNARFTCDVGHPLALGFRAFGRGDYLEAIKLIAPITSDSHRFGGSHAQRDVIGLTLIEAAIRAGEPGLAQRLAQARHAARPASPLSRAFLDRARRLTA